MHEMYIKRGFAGHAETAIGFMINGVHLAIATHKHIFSIVTAINQTLVRNLLSATWVSDYAPPSCSLHSMMIHQQHACRANVATKLAMYTSQVSKCFKHCFKHTLKQAAASKSLPASTHQTQNNHVLALAHHI
jgi:hypothetical protein